MKHVLCFFAGAGLGALTAWYLTKRKYEDIIDAEIESVREFYREEKNEEKQKEEDKKIYKAKVRNLGYADIYEENYDENGVELETAVTNPFPGEPVDCPYVIGPDNYHDETLFDKEHATYYTESDTIVTDSDDILEVDTIGDGLEHFDEYEQDTVYVRNEKLGMDFEIIRVNGAYEPN